MHNTDFNTTTAWCPVCKCEHDAVYETEGNTCVFTVKCPMGERRTRASSDIALFHAMREKHRVPPPKSKAMSTVFQLHLLDSCTLHCPICFSRAAPGKGRQVSIEDIRTWAKDISQRNGHFVALTGGEPTEHPDFLEIVRILNKEFGFDVSVISNGLRFAEMPTFAQACKKSGLKTIQLAFDTFNAETSRLLRGRDLVALKRQAIRNLERAGLQIVLVVTTCEANIREAGEIIKFAMAQAPAINEVRFQPLLEAGRFIPGLKGSDRESVLHAIVDSGAVPGVELKDFIPLPTVPMLGLCPHPDCGSIVPLVVGKDGSTVILSREPGFERILDDLHSYPAGNALWSMLRAHWSIFRHMGMRGLQRVIRWLPGSKSESLFILGSDNMMCPNRQDVNRLNRCMMHIYQKGAPVRPLCACYVDHAPAVACNQ